MLFAVGLAAGMLELAIRGRHYLSHGSIGPVLEFVTHEASELPIPVPGRVVGSLEIDSRGFRSPELEVPKPEGRLRLAFLGGSTTFCAEASSTEAAWPTRVANKLSETFPDADIDFVNAGVSGYSIEKSALNLEHRVASLEPDVIVIYHATNDITKDTRKLAQEAGVYRGHGDAGSWIGRYSLAWALIEKNLLFKKRMRETKAGTERLTIDSNTVALDFETRLTELVREAQELASLVVLPTFSYHVRREHDADKRLAACNTSLFYMPYMTPDGCLEAFEAYNDAIRRVAGATGALLVEGEHEIPGDKKHFNDSVHLIGPGHTKMARRVWTALADEARFKALAAGR